VRVLTLTPFYPSAADDAQGCFIAEPLAALEALGISNTVIAVQPFYRAKVASSTSASTATWARYFSLPGGVGLSSAGCFLFARLLPVVRAIQNAGGLDLIHAHSALPCGHAAALLSKELHIPFAVSVHGLDAFSTNQVRGFPGKWCERVSRMVFLSARHVICISERVQEEVCKRAPSAETTVIYNGVDARMFSPGEECPNPSVLSIGNLIPIKGHASLIRAMATLAKTYATAKLEIIGSGPEKDTLLVLARELVIEDRVLFLGRQSRNQVADAMRRCAIFALPSRYEGLGCVYLEAMCAERPVIACEGQGIAEVIRNGDNGLLVPPDNVERLAESLAALLDDRSLRHRIGAAGRRTILQGFTLEHQARRLARVYEDSLT
jgi:teichuronic acid biosynthesis glycosyltransferase TuaC